VLEKIRTILGEILDEKKSRGEYTFRIPNKKVLDIVTRLNKDPALQFNILANETAVHWPEKEKPLEMVYNLLSTIFGHRINLKVDLAKDEEVESLAPLFKAALFNEREVYDLYGIKFRNHPDLRRILLPSDWLGHPLLKDYPIQGPPEAFDWEVHACEKPMQAMHDVYAEPKWAIQQADTKLAAPSGEGEHPLGPRAEIVRDVREGTRRNIELNLGPQHPSTHGVLRILVELEGEVITKMDSDIGYLHRGIEKLMEHKGWLSGIAFTDRLDYIGGMLNNLGHVLSIEKLLGIVPNRRIQYMRVLVCEMNRIASHLLWLATHALDIGAMSVFLYCFRERELILDFFEEICGARLTTSYFRIGGLTKPLTPKSMDMIADFLKIFPDRYKEYDTLLTRNRIWMGRTKGIGYLSKEDALSYATTGPILRGSGIAWDLRKSDPYEIYDELDFDIAVQEEGDIYARYLVRMQEMLESHKMVGQCLEFLKQHPEEEKVSKGTYDKKTGYEVQEKAYGVARMVKPPAGDAYRPIESTKGELGYYMVSTGVDMPYKVKIRSPSFINLGAMPAVLHRGMVADIVAAIGSFDVVLGEIDR